MGADTIVRMISCQDIRLQKNPLIFSGKPIKPTEQFDPALYCLIHCIFIVRGALNNRYLRFIHETAFLLPLIQITEPGYFTVIAL
ncbi:hypothetical protein ES703_102064 [subsurface metagenome]